MQNSGRKRFRRHAAPPTPTAAAARGAAMRQERNATASNPEEEEEEEERVNPRQDGSSLVLICTDTFVFLTCTLCLTLNL